MNIGKSIVKKNANRTIAETIVSERSKERLIETVEYYLNELDNTELITKLEAEAIEAGKDLAEKQATEEASDYSDAMQSMERTYAEGFADALEMAIRILKEGK
jgi:regulator of replication initiation timing